MTTGIASGALFLLIILAACTVATENALHVDRGLPTYPPTIDVSHGSEPEDVPYCLARTLSFCPPPPGGHQSLIFSHLNTPAKRFSIKIQTAEVAHALVALTGPLTILPGSISLPCPPSSPLLFHYHNYQQYNVPW